MCSNFPAPTKQALGFSLDIPANRVSSYRLGEVAVDAKKRVQQRGGKPVNFGVWGGDQAPPGAGSSLGILYVQQEFPF